MYDVSEKYKKAIKGTSIKARIEGTIKTVSGKTYQINDSNIVKGSLSLDNKCVNDSEFCFGAVYIGQMGVSIYNDTIDRYSLNDAEITASYFLTLEDGTEEEVPLGVFVAYDIQRSRKIIQFSCYDNMSKFDIDITEDTFGTAFELLSYISTKAGVPLHSTENEILQMENSDIVLSISAEMIGTYRDALSLITSLLCAYATIDRTGGLVIRQFKKTASDSISARRRMSSSIQDYSTYFKKVMVRFLAEQNFEPYSAEDTSRSTGLTLDLGDNPMVLTTPEVKKLVVQKIMDHLKLIQYVPMNLTMVADPAIDLGDAFTLLNVNNGTDSIFTIITGYSWTYHNTMTLESVGSDPLLANISNKDGKSISRLEREVNSKSLVVRQFSNAQTLNINQSESDLASITFTGSESTTVIVFLTLPVQMSLDGDLKLKFIFNGEDRDVFTAYCEKGHNIVTVSNAFEIEKDALNRLVIKASAEYVESDCRIQDAKIRSFKDWIDNQKITSTTDSKGNITSVFDYDYVDKPVDQTQPVGTVEELTMKGILFAQALNAENKWDGNLEIKETIGIVEMNQIIPVMGLVDRMTINPQRPSMTTLNQYVGRIELPMVLIAGIDDIGAVNDVKETENVSFSGSCVTTQNGKTILKTHYVLDGHAEVIDSGQMVAVQYMTSDKASVSFMGVTFSEL